MAGYDGRGTQFPLTIPTGADLAFALTVTDAADAAIDVSAATIAGELYDAAGAVVDTLSSAVSGAGSNVVTLSLTDTETAALVGVVRWTLWVARGGDKRPWLAGPVKLVEASSGKSTAGSSTTLVVDSDVNVAVSVNAVGVNADEVALADSGGNYTAATIEAAFAELPSRYAPAYQDATVWTDGTYTRTTTGTFRGMAVDPGVSGRVWGVDGTDIVYRDSDGGGASVVAIARPSAQSVIQIEFTGSFAFFLTTSSTDRSGQLWRSPLPAADGTGLSFDSPNGKLFDLTGLTTTVAGEVDGGVNSYFRNQCFTTDNGGQQGYICEYGTTVTGGPSIYYNANINVGNVSSVLWAKRQTFADAKHAHAIKWINGRPWMTLGDAGFSDLGVWVGGANGASWVRRSLYGPDNGGTYDYGINLFPITIESAPVIISEFDGYGPAGPLVHGSQTATVNRPTRRLCDLPIPYYGSMRALTITSEGNLMWLTTAENGALGDFDSIWIAKPPFGRPILLESFASANTLGTIYNATESGDFVFFGTSRCLKPALI